jgi:streptomycin 6-kinase
VTELQSPARLAAHSAERAGWVAALPETVTALAARWRLILGPPFEPGGECSWVAPACPDLVLKVGWTHDEARDVSLPAPMRSSR